MAIGDPPFGYWLGGILPPNPEAQIDPEKIVRHREIQALQNEVASLRERLEVLERYVTEKQEADVAFAKSLEEPRRPEDAALDWGGMVEVRTGFTPKAVTLASVPPEMFQSMRDTIPAPVIMSGMERAEIDAFEVSCGGSIKAALYAEHGLEPPPLNYPVMASPLCAHDKLPGMCIDCDNAEYEKATPSGPICPSCGDETSHVPNGMHCRGKK